VLKIKPAAMISLAADPAARGRMLHEALAEAHRQFRFQSPGAALSAQNADQFRQLFLDAIETSLSTSPAGGPLVAALRRIDAAAVRLLCEPYLAQHAAYAKKQDAPLQPRYFEVSFGRRSGEDDRDAEFTSNAPLVIRSGAIEAQIQGTIDRIDVGTVGQYDVFSVIDYKSGKSARPQDVLDPARMQLEIYALAASRILFADQAALPWQAGYWFLTAGGYRNWLSMYERSAGGDAPEPTEIWRSRQEQVTATIAALVAAVRHGEFPMHSRDQHCTSYCDFHTVCRVRQARHLEKQWEPPTID
jgi:ATP-dependent helicase/DNAse subunit B